MLQRKGWVVLGVTEGHILNKSSYMFIVYPHYLTSFTMTFDFILFLHVYKIKTKINFSGRTWINEKSIKE